MLDAGAGHSREALGEPVLVVQTSAEAGGVAACLRQCRPSDSPSGLAPRFLPSVESRGGVAKQLQVAAADRRVRYGVEPLSYAVGDQAKGADAPVRAAAPRMS